MRNNDKINFWIQSAKRDWRAAQHLFEKKDYPYALFFGHLTVEKLLKGLYLNNLKKSPPFTHSLTFLAEHVNLQLNAEQIELLEIITDFNLEARYPDEKFSFHKKCTAKFTENYLKKIEELTKWLLKQLQS